MKIRLEIDSTEKFSNQRNLLKLLEMVLEECDGRNGSGQTSYNGGGGKQTCKYSLTTTE